MTPEPQKKLPSIYQDEQDLIDSLTLYVDYLICLINSGATQGSPEADACYTAYCLAFDQRFPV